MYIFFRYSALINLNEISITKTYEILRRYKLVMVAEDISRIGYQKGNLIPKDIKGYQLTNTLNLHLSNMVCKLGIYEK